ncbi:MAG: transposase [Candidatus Omnitrophica bacterium]|nr:transposase [Candidatus Omnitrophota bacterium]
MPRKPRFLLEGPYYHIVQRGTNKLGLFWDKEDYEVFMDLVLRYKRKYSFELYNYSLMSNHIHLLIKALNGVLPKIFQGIFQVYQYHYRKKYSYVGHLYQNRFKSIPITCDSQLLCTARYIDRNHFKDVPIPKFIGYEWSSCNFYVKNEKNTLITPNPAYLELAGTPAKRRNIYLDYLQTSNSHTRTFDVTIDKLAI